MMFSIVQKVSKGPKCMFQKCSNCPKGPKIFQNWSNSVQKDINGPKMAQIWGF